MTQSIRGFTPSLTKACKTWLSIGRRMSTMPASSDDEPATDSATFPARMKPRLVSTPVTRPFSRRMPVTAQFWTMSTPRSLAARA